MSKNNEYRKLQSWDPKPEVQRAVEKEFYSKTDDTMRHKKKSDKKGKERSDHKHVYIDAVIYKTYYDGSQKPYNGKVCSVCGKQHTKNWMSYFHTEMGSKEVCIEGLPSYKAVDENIAIPFEPEGFI